MILTTVVALTYPLAIQYKRGGLYRVLYPFAAVVLALDVLASYTEWWLVFGKPAPGDHTITARIRSMHQSSIESQRNLARMAQVYLDACEPDGKH